VTYLQVYEFIAITISPALMLKLRASLLLLLLTQPLM